MLRPPTLARVRCLLSAGGGLAAISFQTVLGLFVPWSLVERLCPFFLKVPWLVTERKKGKPVFSLDMERWWRFLFVSFENQLILALFCLLCNLSKSGVGLHKFLVLYQFCEFGVLAN